MRDPHAPRTPGKSPTTSQSLLDQARHDDGEAWKRIYALYLPLVYKWCRKRGLNDLDTADVAQDVFAAVYAKLSTFEKVRADQSFRAWLRTITENKVTDHYRRALRQPLLGNGVEIAWDPEAPSPDSDSASTSDDDDEEQVFILRRCITMVRSEFEPRTWEAFWMVVVEEKPPALAAERLGMNRNAVYLAKSRVLNRLKRLFDKLVDDFEIFR